MPTASYYREQARLLMRWGQLARDPAVAEQLTNRAQQMLEMAEQRDEQRGPFPLDLARPPAFTLSKSRAKGRGFLD